MLAVSTVGSPAALALRASLSAFCLTRLMSWECGQAIVPIWWSINSMAALSGVKAALCILAPAFQRFPNNPIAGRLTDLAPLGAGVLRESPGRGVFCGNFASHDAIMVALKASLGRKRAPILAHCIDGLEL